MVTCQLGFKNVRLYNSFSEGTLCLVVDPDLEKKQSRITIDRNAFILEHNVARSLNCKTLILQINFLTSEDEKDIAQNNVTLPLENQTQLESIFGNPEQFEIKEIKEDNAYKRDLETYEAIFVSFLKEASVISESGQVNGKTSLVSSYEKKVKEEMVTEKQNLTPNVKPNRLFQIKKKFLFKTL